ncbi:protein FRA10AC1 isoform X1 [Carex littledalei]|uniref:Protein FRA10AC1 isoform X1 n=1 Tax=Carex littledalei TaxID=544730 RepID=A0A833VWB2_9POAL|nr:protein FRA10AC1 isoform X1 [Carex littledalei]
MASLGNLKSAIWDKQEKKLQYQSQVRGLNAYDRHKKFMNDYVQFYGHDKNENSTIRIKTDQDALREGYRFILSEDDDLGSAWVKRLVKRYHDKLYKEYCIADMSTYRSGKIGLRWRTEKEVVSGKGQFICGNKKCDERDGLGSYEVNFSYVEAGEHKQALVKLVACPRCAEKLAYKRQKEKQKEEHSRKREREQEEYDDSPDDEPAKSDHRRTKARKGANSDSDEEENFNEFLEGMFP